MYKLLKSFESGSVNGIKRLSDAMTIPLNPDNTDYQAYLRWCEEGNTPLPAENE